MPIAKKGGGFRPRLFMGRINYNTTLVGRDPLLIILVSQVFTKGTLGACFIVSPFPMRFVLSLSGI